VTAQVFFASGQTGLPADLAATLQPVIEAARARPSTRLAISGFHDRTGNPEMNAEIAKQRAFAIRDALTVAGVDVSRIELRKPQDMVGGTDDALARRVEVTLQ
jgi:outer membrane protein OmpA-like peptidoglycan-associated protein